jgi:protein transport protein SEC24
LHYKTIFNQIRRVLSRPICWESVNRTRFSSGYKISSFSTPCLVTNVDLFIFPTGDSDQNFLFSIAPPPPTPTEDESESKKNNNDILLNNYDYDDKNKYIFIQSALLYSYGDGSRRIRVHNLCLPISDNIKNIYSEINSEMLATFYLKDTIDKLYKTKNIANSIISTDTKFKLFIDKVMSTQNKIDKELLPNLDYLPYYMLGMFKHRIFCKDEIEKNYDIDISNFLRISLQKFSTSEIISYIVPSIYSLQEMEVDKSIGTYNNETGEFAMPNLISLSRSAMEDNGLYLIDNGYLLIIYVKKNVSSNIFQSLFGVENIKFLTMITNEENVFEENDGNELKERIKNILDYIRSSKSIFQNLVFVFEGDGGERLINECLIEDNFCKWFPMDYATFYKKYIKGNNSFGY